MYVYIFIYIYISYVYVRERLVIKPNEAGWYMMVLTQLIHHFPAFNFNTPLRPMVW